MERRTEKRKLCFLCFYAGFMLCLLLIRQRDVGILPYWQNTAQHFNPVPFRTIRLYFRLLHNRRWMGQAIANLVGNVLLFVPMGYLLPGYVPVLRKFYRTVLAAMLIMAVVEALQMLLLVGTCDIDDLILNTTGAAIGYGIYRLFG